MFHLANRIAPRTLAQTDDDIDAKLADTRRALYKLGSRTECVAPTEGSTHRF